MFVFAILHTFAAWEANAGSKDSERQLCQHYFLRFASEERERGDLLLLADQSELKQRRREFMI